MAVRDKFFAEVTSRLNELAVKWQAERDQLVGRTVALEAELITVSERIHELDELLAEATIEIEAVGERSRDTKGVRE